MLKRLLSCVSILVAMTMLASFLFACGNTTAKTATLSNAKALNGMYVLSSDGESLTPVAQYEVTHSSNLITGGNISTGDSFSYRFFANAEPTHIDLQKNEKLILCGKEGEGVSDTTACLATESGYTNTEILGNSFNYEKIDNKDVPQISTTATNEETKQFWTDMGFSNYALVSPDGTAYYALISDTQKNVTVGKYEGTTWVDKTLSFNTPSSVTSSIVDSIPVDRSNDGYFIIDISALPSGTYCDMSAIDKKKYYFFSK